MAQQQKQQDIQEFDYVKLLFHCLHHWYWFVLCVGVCVGLAVLYLQMKTPVFSTSSTIMIRTDNNMSRSSLQTDMLELMGYQTSKIIDDEIARVKDEGGQQHGDDGDAFKESTCRSYISRKLKKKSPLTAEDIVEMRKRVEQLVAHKCEFTPEVEQRLKELKVL